MNLHSVGGRAIRPTSSRLRQAAFHILGEVADTRGLDLFCGAGTFGLEAISRGAALVVFVDRSAEALGLVGRNVQKMGVGTSVAILRHDLTRGLAPRTRQHAPFHWAFLDPPYAAFRQAPSRAALERLLTSLGDPELLVPGGLVLLEHPTGIPVPQAGGRLRPREDRPYGEASLAFLETSGAPGNPAAD